MITRFQVEVPHAQSAQILDSFTRHISVKISIYHISIIVSVTFHFTFQSNLNYISIKISMLDSIKVSIVFHSNIVSYFTYISSHTM